jgi:DNA-binding LytR/AlgR family response regulator
MKIRTVLVDDEEMALVNLKFALEEYQDIDVIAQFTDPFEAVEKIYELQPDAVLLDIDMPGINGLEAALEIKNGFPQAAVVFVTAYNQYALNAFEVNAVDYVLKPVSSKRLKPTVERLSEICALKRTESERHNFNHINALMQDMQAAVRTPAWTSKKIPALKNDRIFLLDPNEILYITASLGTVSVVAEGGSFTSRNTIRQLEEKHKQSGFFRCSKSFLINLDKVDVILPSFKGLFTVKLKNCRDEIPVSRHYVEEFKRLLNL